MRKTKLNSYYASPASIYTSQIKHSYRYTHITARACAAVLTYSTYINHTVILCLNTEVDILRRRGSENTHSPTNRVMGSESRFGSHFSGRKCEVISQRRSPVVRVRGRPWRRMAHRWQLGLASAKLISTTWVSMGSVGPGGVRHFNLRGRGLSRVNQPSPGVPATLTSALSSRSLVENNTLNYTAGRHN